ncbi:ankyrin repeat domain-containing protein [Dactylosporangium sucinum]|uniref:Ankyrin repeat protein n=1 Tax=Dactylosporangium sucinum TaxID=1424081 RepID=A0A917U6N7_9ACTN|nr:ankyrin repeat domain-containing protein [Dactylosporangium sucinum]GGM62498.1 hypothetical protein GCM10007977_075110 [Dactylosporangium sucinum]
MTELKAWARLRRYAVPRWMIEDATARRLAGDWAGACAAADVELGPELAAVPDAVAEDLRHLVPDLLRWHLPRDPVTHDLPRDPIPLAHYADGHALVVQRRHSWGEGQRLMLRYRGSDPAHEGDGLHLNRERWDGRRTAGLRVDADPELLRLQDAGEWRAAWTRAGFDVEQFDDATAPRYARDAADARLRAGDHDLTGLAEAVRATADRHHAPAVRLPLRWRDSVVIDAATLRVRHAGAWNPAHSAEGPLPVLPAARALRPVDFDLVRLGYLPVSALHPLVASALFPGAPAAAVAEPVAVEPIRVRCLGDWHLVTMAASGFTTPHAPEELRREQAMHALGGPPPTGCFAAVTGWSDPRVRLPKHLRTRRRTVVLRAAHGDAPAIEALLDAGLDPSVRDGRGRTLLHLLSFCPHPVPLLRRLVAAGLDLETRDQNGYTPLLHAVACGGTVALVTALLELGARRDVSLPDGSNAVELARRYGRNNEFSVVLGR